MFVCFLNQQMSKMEVTSPYFSKYYMKILYWFDYPFCEWGDSCICWKSFSWCYLMVTLDTFKRHIYYLFSSSNILIWEELFFRACSLWGQHPVGALLFPLASCLFKELLTSIGCIVTFFLLQTSILPWA